MKSKFNTLFDLNCSLFGFAGEVKLIDYFFRHNYVFSLMKKNSPLENVVDNAKRKCYIIGLGPSLRTVDLDKIEGDTIVVNRFFKVGESAPRFIPTYYVIGDEQFANKDNIKDLEHCLLAYSGKGTRYFLDARFKTNPIISKFNDESFYYISGFKGLIKPSKKYSLSKPGPVLFNSVCTAIFLAINMGYKHIYLLGCDFSSFATPMPQHVYEEEKKEKLRSLSMELFCYSFAAWTHEQLQQYAKNNGVEIINSTKDSLIDAYPIDIDESLYK